MLAIPTQEIIHTIGKITHDWELTTQSEHPQASHFTTWEWQAKMATHPLGILDNLYWEKAHLQEQGLSQVKTS